MKLTAIILTRNEEKNIKECLSGLFFADEILVIDDNSTDNTVSIAGQQGAVVISHPLVNFSDQHNFAAAKASGDWLIFVDADERIDQKLAKDLKIAIENKDYSGYKILRLNNFLGRNMYHGGWYPEYLLRLFKKDALTGWVGEIHETAEVKGKIGQIDTPLLHLAHRNLTEMLEKTILWSKIEAKLRFQNHHPKMVWWRFFRVMFSEFWYRGIIKAGWKDGVVGVIEIIYQTFSIFITYARLWEMQNRHES